MTDVSALLDSLNDEPDFHGVTNAGLCIFPPRDTGLATEEDSGDEDGGTINNLSRHQLLAEAELRVHGPNFDEEDEISLAQLAQQIPHAAPTAGSATPTNSNQGTVISLNSPTTPAPAPQRRRVQTSNVLPIPVVAPEWVANADRPATAKTWVWPDAPPSLDTQLESEALFRKFFSEDLVEFICRQTQNYSVFNNRRIDVDLSDMYTFIEILIYTGYVDCQRRSLYWDTLGNTPELAQNAMPRNRFDSIMKNLHFTDNANLDPNDRFAKVRPILDHIKNKCLEHWIPEQVVSIDESMIPYYGRHGAKQHMHGKPIKFGYKAWVAASRLGYAISFFPYAGAGDHDRALGLGGTVASRLLESLPPKHYHLVFDNFFTSVPLLYRIAAKGSAATGTIRQNRCQGIPLPAVKVIKKKPRGTYESAYDSKNEITAVRWNDNRAVTVLSTFTGVAPVGKAKRRARNQPAVDVDIPNSARLYNFGMGGVDTI